MSKQIGELEDGKIESKETCTALIRVSDIQGAYDDSSLAAALAAMEDWGEEGDRTIPVIIPMSATPKVDIKDARLGAVGGE